jgi:hypothetical protein
MVPQPTPFPPPTQLSTPCLHRALARLSPVCARARARVCVCVCVCVCCVCVLVFLARLNKLILDIFY